MFTPCQQRRAIIYGNTYLVFFEELQQPRGQLFSNYSWQQHSYLSELIVSRWLFVKHKHILFFRNFGYIKRSKKSVQGSCFHVMWLIVTFRFTQTPQGRLDCTGTIIDCPNACEDCWSGCEVTLHNMGKRMIWAYWRNNIAFWMEYTVSRTLQCICEST